MIAFWNGKVKKMHFLVIARHFKAFFPRCLEVYGTLLTVIVELRAHFCIANALEVLIHFDMLIREHYARNEIKWQHEVICLSLN